jgi:hypothetical protein
VGKVVAILKNLPAPNSLTVTPLTVTSQNGKGEIKL